MWSALGVDGISYEALGHDAGRVNRALHLGDNMARNDFCLMKYGDSLYWSRFCQDTQFLCYGPQRPTPADRLLPAKFSGASRNEYMKTLAATDRTPAPLA